MANFTHVKKKTNNYGNKKKPTYKIGIDRNGKQYKYNGNVLKPLSPIMTIKLNKQEIDLLKILKNKFPNVFNSENPLPLARGIHTTIKERLKAEKIPFTSTHFFRAIKSWCGMINYKKSLISQTYRFDLDGRKSEAITADDKKDALQALQFFMQEHKAREERLAKKKHKFVKKGFIKKDSSSNFYTPKKIQRTYQ